MRVTRKVRDLQIGDRLTSGVIVVRMPVRGLKTPAGRHEVAIRYPDGYVRLATWNSDTKMLVEPLDKPV